MMADISGVIKTAGNIRGVMENAGSIGGNMGAVHDYNLCTNKPRINGAELVGDTELTGIVRNYTGTLSADGWSDTAPFMQAVDIVGITADMSPLVDIVLSDDIDTVKAEQAAWGYITKAVAVDGGIVFYCYDAVPKMDITIKVKAV